MYISVRRSLELVLSIIALLGPLTARGQAPIRPGTITPTLLNPPMNPVANFSALSGASSITSRHSAT
jgi:hypothetical protein